MLEIVSSVTCRGQVTIPARVRRHLGMDTPGKVAFILGDDGTVVLKPVTMTIARFRGIVPALPNTSADSEKEIEAAIEERANHIMAKMRQQ
ncbi:MAG: AbrB/MazE/SpoVT family DNA-binding domain-containing protein [Chloroflexota bacterium]|nr:AbrB/MazE/SpoVT family DNA-binding domain-containing protein [Chloroflexota bacterium]